MDKNYNSFAPNNSYNTKNQSFYFSYEKGEKNQNPNSSYTVNLNMSSKDSNIRVIKNMEDDSNNNAIDLLKEILPKNETKDQAINEDAEKDNFSLNKIFNNPNYNKTINGN